MKPSRNSIEAYGKVKALKIATKSIKYCVFYVLVECGESTTMNSVLQSTELETTEQRRW